MGRQKSKAIRALQQFKWNKVIAKAQNRNFLVSFTNSVYFLAEHYQTFTVTVLMEFSEILTQVFSKSLSKGKYCGPPKMAFCSTS